MAPALQTAPEMKSEVEIPQLLPRASAIPFRLLDESGELTAEGSTVDHDIDAVAAMFRDMSHGRRLDQQALYLQRQGELGLWLMSLGQEAAQVGSIRALRDTDHVFPSYREHVAALCRGVTPAELMAQWRGVAHAGWSWERSRFHFYSLVLGSQTLHATGYAMGLQRDGVDDEIVMVYVGDGATSQGDVNEALNWSAVHDAPVVFFCQNNQWAISTPTSAQFRGALHRRANGFGLRSYLVDGNDVLAVHAVTRAAARHARAGGGPVFVEAETFRMAGHSTSDDPRRYRDDMALAAWEVRDPLHRVERFLRSAGFAETFFGEVVAEGEELAEEVRRACRGLEAPDLTELFETAYAETHPVASEQRAEWLRFRGTLEADVR